MRPDWKTCFRICVSVFALYLCIFYWESLSKLLGTLLSALSPLILGLVIAYVLNILMSFYERHYFPKSRKPWVKNSRPVVCLLAAILTLIAIVTLVVDLVVPELISCVKLLLSSVEPAVEKLLDSQWIAQLLPADILQRLNAIDWGDLIQKAVKVVGAGLGSAAGAVFATVSSVVSSVVNVFLAIIFAVYLLLSRDTLQQQGRRLLGRHRGHAGLHAQAAPLAEGLADLHIGLGVIERLRQFHFEAPRNAPAPA